MNNPTNTDLHRDIGRLEGEMIGIRQDVSELKATILALHTKMDDIQARDNRLRGAWGAIAVIAAAVGSISTVILSHFWK